MTRPETRSVWIFFQLAELNRWGMRPLRGRILSGKTLSGQRENKAGVEVNYPLNLKRRAACEASIDVVPPFQFVPFAELPAEQDHPAVPK